VKSRTMPHRLRDQKRRARFFAASERSLFRKRRLLVESLEARQMLATLYVDNAGDFAITNDQGGAGLDNGDTVTWSPGAGSQHGAAVAGLIFGASAFATIQSAVNAANVAGGDVIRVAAGTFSELVTVERPVQIFGNQVGVDAQGGRAGALETIVNGTLSGAVRSSSFRVTADQVEINGLVSSNQTNVNLFGAGIVLAPGTSGSKIRNNILRDNVVGLFLANDTAGGANQTIVERNLFRDNDQPGAAAGSGIYADEFTAGATLTNVLITNNTFLSHDGTGGAINLSSTAAGSQTNIAMTNNLFGGNSRALVAFNLVNSSFTGNEVTNSNFTGSADLRIFNGVSNFQITNNILSGNGTDLRGMRISDLGLPGGLANNITFAQNSVSNYGTAGVIVDAGAYAGGLNAEFNWWNSATGPTHPNNPAGTGQVITDPDGVVDFSPFLTTGTDSLPAVRGFSRRPARRSGLSRSGRGKTTC
jgi:hypothetical protein